MSDRQRFGYDRLLRSLFGDRYGLVLFLAVLAVTMLFWRSNVFINDNDTLVRTLGALSEGRLWIESASGESVFNAPGAEVRDGLVYGRNYGQLVVSLPALWLLRVLDAVADIRIVLTALWHLVVLALVVQTGHLLDREEYGESLVVAGSLLVVVSFVVTLGVATPFDDPSLELFALQVTSLVATAFAAVFAYRLVAFQATTQLGFLSGFAVALVLPVGFWASIPKRHVFTVLVCVAILYAFARSRDADATTTLPAVGPVPLSRAAAYALVGFLTWIHAAEGLFVFLALVAVDLPTAPSNDRYTLAFVAAVFALSLVPTVVTNWLVTGHPARPPRTLGGGLTTPASADPSPATDDSAGLLERLFDSLDVFPLSVVTFLVSNVVELVGQSLTEVTTGSTAYHTFLRSAGISFEKGHPQFSSANLSVLESAPILAALIGVVATALTRVRSTDLSRAGLRRLLGRLDPTATLSATLTLAFFGIYLSRLPLHIQINVRYLLPVYPLGLYLLVRSDHIQSLVTDHSRVLYWSYSATVLFGGQVLFATTVARDLAVAEATQLHALIALVSAGVLAVLVSVSAFDDRVRAPATAALGAAAAVGTAFLLLGGLHYFSFGGYVLPVIDQLVDFVSF